tara:strand:+ start:427 stop:531 length:105 start_codon:yes stop_codon:yes gene_type:complete
MIKRILQFLFNRKKKQSRDYLYTLTMKPKKENEK